MKTKKPNFGPVQVTILDWLVKQPAGKLFSPHTAALESGLIMMDVVEERDMDLIATAYARARSCLARLTVETEHRPALIDTEAVEIDGYYFELKQFKMLRKGRQWYLRMRT